MRARQIVVWAAMGVTAALMAGCHVETDKNGDNKNVTVSTPFGGLQVKTNDAAVLESIGLPAYPGAEAVKDKDNGSADVNMNFGSFQMRVKAAGYRTDDTPDKVETFYRNGLKRFGDVVACRDGHAVGTPTKTPEGLACDDEGKAHININAGDHPGKDQLQLKAGSSRHQHMVEIEPDGGGTKFGLVALDLPGTSEGVGQ